MDATIFDGFVRSLAKSETRRGLLRRGAAAAAGAALIGLGARMSVAAEVCRGSGLRCRRDDQCCSGKCRNRLCKPADLQVGEACDPDVPTDCVTDVCGCAAKDINGKPANCTCRRATCSPEVGVTGCADSADCCDGHCIRSHGGVCFPPQQLCIPGGASCSSAPTLCCPGFTCTDGVCTA
jgi:hypothetical protein